MLLATRSGAAVREWGAELHLVVELEAGVNGISHELAHLRGGFTQSPAIAGGGLTTCDPFGARDSSRTCDQERPARCCSSRRTRLARAAPTMLPSSPRDVGTQRAWIPPTPRLVRTVGRQSEESLVSAESLDVRVVALEERMAAVVELAARMSSLDAQLLQSQTERQREFSAIR